MPNKPLRIQYLEFLRNNKNCVLIITYILLYLIILFFLNSYFEIKNLYLKCIVSLVILLFAILLSNISKNVNLLNLSLDLFLLLCLGMLITFSFNIYILLFILILILALLLLNFGRLLSKDYAKALNDFIKYFLEILFLGINLILYSSFISKNVEHIFNQSLPINILVLLWVLIGIRICCLIYYYRTSEKKEENDLFWFKRVL